MIAVVRFIALPAIHPPNDEWKTEAKSWKSSGKVVINWLPVPSHHRTYRSGIRRFVRIISSDVPFSNKSNCGILHIPSVGSSLCWVSYLARGCGRCDWSLSCYSPFDKPSLCECPISTDFGYGSLVASIASTAQSSVSRVPSHPVFASSSYFGLLKNSSPIPLSLPPSSLFSPLRVWGRYVSFCPSFSLWSVSVLWVILWPLISLLFGRRRSQAMCFWLDG